MKNKLLMMNLQMFAEDGEGNGDGAGTGNNSGSKGTGATYSYEQAEQIAQARADRASKSALTNYFKQQGMSEEEAQEAFKDFKAKKEAGKPNVAEIEKQRDEATAKLAAYENKATLAELGANSEFTDFLMHTIKAQVTDKKDFKACAEEYLKANPQYCKQAQSFRMSSGSASVNTGTGEGKNTNESFNNILRKSFGRK